jgi:putative hemolysin
MPRDLLEIYLRAQESETGAHFAQRLLESLNIRFEVDPADLKRIPASGAAMVAANHPYGIVEGLVLTILLDSVRRDFHIVANSMLSGVAALRAQTVLLNPFRTAGSVVQNRQPLRQCVRCLSGGGLLAMFPAGEVAHLDLGRQSVTDPPWKTTAVRLALRARCGIVPVFFDGANSAPFQLAGLLHPGLRTMSLAREFRKMRSKTVRVRIGSAIACNVLKRFQHPVEATEYLRSRTYFLSLGLRSDLSQPKPAKARMRPAATGAPGAERLLTEEVAALGPDCELISTSEFGVYMAEPARIPALLREIGRCREIAFREVGEGTGRETDLDRFDAHYRHLFLWHKGDRRLAGAYRPASTLEVLPRFGIDGLYTSTLFRYRPEFFERLGPALELGRSFIRPEYQRSYAPLLLLWKGITRVVERQPEAAVLFGAVSISRDYRHASRGLIAAYLSRRASHELAHLVQPCGSARPVETLPELRALSSSAAKNQLDKDAQNAPIFLASGARRRVRAVHLGHGRAFAGTIV